MNDNVIIRTENVQKHFKGGQIKALDGVSTSIHQGEVVVVIGPSGSGKSYSCAVKTGSSIISPVIEISDNSLPSYNYAYISNFKRYYFITNIVYDRGIWVLSLTVDVMATYRPGIGNTSSFVLRSSRRSQPALIDTLYPVTGNSIVNQNVFEAMLTRSSVLNSLRCFSSF